MNKDANKNYGTIIAPLEMLVKRFCEYFFEKVELVLCGADFPRNPLTKRKQSAQYRVGTGVLDGP